MDEQFFTANESLFQHADLHKFLEMVKKICRFFPLLSTYTRNVSMRSRYCAANCRRPLSARNHPSQLHHRIPVPGRAAMA